MELSLYVFFAFLGALVASFIGVISERIYTGQSWKTGRSKCNSCKESLGFLDLIPVFSYVLTFGRCRVCGSKVPYGYPLGEAVMASLFLFGYYTFGLSLQLLVFLVILGVLFFIVIYDIRHTIVPTEASTALVLLGLVFAYLESASIQTFGLTLLVAGVISLCFFALHFFSRGRAMGLGDAPVVFALSLLAGEQAIEGLLFSFWIGALFGLGVLLTKPPGKRRNIEIPFVPFLALGYLLAIISGWQLFVLY